MGWRHGRRWGWRVAFGLGRALGVGLFFFVVVPMLSISLLPRLIDLSNKLHQDTYFLAPLILRLPMQTARQLRHTSAALSRISCEHLIWQRLRRALAASTFATRAVFLPHPPHKCRLMWQKLGQPRKDRPARSPCRSVHDSSSAMAPTSPRPHVREKCFSDEVGGGGGVSF